MTNEELVKEYLVTAYINLCYAGVAAEHGVDNKKDYVKDFEVLSQKLRKDSSSNDLFISCLNALDALAAYADITFYKNAILHRENLKSYLKLEDKIYNESK